MVDVAQYGIVVSALSFLWKFLLIFLRAILFSMFEIPVVSFCWWNLMLFLSLKSFIESNLYVSCHDRAFPSLHPLTAFENHYSLTADQLFHIFQLFHWLLSAIVCMDQLMLLFKTCDDHEELAVKCMWLFQPTQSYKQPSYFLTFLLYHFSRWNFFCKSLICKLCGISCFCISYLFSWFYFHFLYIFAEVRRLESIFGNLHDRIVAGYLLDNTMWKWFDFTRFDTVPRTILILKLRIYNECGDLDIWPVMASSVWNILMHSV